jgi:hypothetical protein
MGKFAGDNSAGVGQVDRSARKERAKPVITGMLFGESEVDALNLIHVRI